MRHLVVVQQVLFQRGDEGAASRLQPDAVVDARVVHQSVDAPELMLYSLNRALAVLLIAEIGYYDLGLRLQLA